MFAPSECVDIELEVAFFVGQGNDLGDPITIDAASKHIFGMTLMNDWTARDIQKHEYVPLGPFNGKNFGTSISPWIVTLAALEPFKCEAIAQDPPVLPYLDEGSSRHSFDIPLTIACQGSSSSASTVISRSNVKNLYWSFEQMLVGSIHHRQWAGSHRGSRGELRTGNRYESS